MADRWIDYVPLDDIVRADENPRDHDLDLIAASMRRFGFADAPVHDGRTGRLIAGHGRLEALQLIRSSDDPAAPAGVEVRDGVWWVPVQYGWSSVDDREAEAMLVVLNRATEVATWRAPELAAMLERVAATDLGLEGVGYTPPELEAMLAATVTVHEHERAVPEDDDDDRITVPSEPVTRPGDVWQLGPHRLICGDCRDPEVWDRLLEGRPINLAVTSPPYADRRKYDESSGFRPISPDAYVDWFEPIAACVADRLTDDGSWLVNIKAGSNGIDRERYVLDLVLAHIAQGWHWAEEFCWERNGVPREPSRRLKNQHEPVYQFTRGEWKWRPDAVRHASDNVPQYLTETRVSQEEHQGSGGMTFGKVRNVGRGDTGWSTRQGDRDVMPADLTAMPGLAYPGNRLPTFAGTHEATGHAAAYPVGLPEFFVKLMTDEGDVVVDPFMGSGSTMLAAHRQGRVGMGIELSPAYCDVIVERMRRRAGLDPVLIRASEA